jgi:exopolysaccharide biosynthesis protein
MRGSKTALGGGPMLVHQGRRQKISRDGAGTYESDSMFERHPRSAIGWNKDYYFLVVVDGRQKNLSVGMTLEELSACMSDLGCEEALNLDGGGSSTLWYDGKVVNSPCDGVERNVANAIVVVQKPPRSLETAHPKENPTSQ